MKNIFKFIGIIGLVLVIGFSIIGCKDDDNGNNDDGGTSFWTSANLEGVYTSSQMIISVASSGSKFIATSDSGSGKLASSDDGITWTVLHNGGALPGLGFNANKVSYAGSMFFAFDKKLAYSVDNGATWTAVTNTGSTGSGFSDQQINNIISNNSYYIALRGGHVNPIIHSKDGKDWQNPTLSTIDGDLSTSDIINDGTFASNLLVMVGKYARIYRFSDPSYEAWNTQYPKFVSLTSKDNPFGKSTDGLNKRDSIYGIACSPYPASILVAVGEKGKITCSDNLGLSWSAVTSPFDSNTIINGVAYGGGKFVAVGSGGKTATSTDGKKWTVEKNSSTKDIYSIAYGSGRFVAVGNGWIGYSEEIK